MRKILVIIIAIAASLIAMTILSEVRGERFPYPMHHMYGGSIMWLLTILLVAAGVYLIFYYSKSTNQESALEILKKRYAKGEISEEDFKRMKDEIK